MNFNKLLSGKFIFTVITGFVFAYTACKSIISGEQVYGIIMLVVAFYFGKRSETDNSKPKA